jgi:hypothetical protein
MLRSKTSLLLKQCTVVPQIYSNTQARNVRAVLSRNDEEARRNVWTLYRKVIKMIPWMKDIFHLPFEPKDMLHIVRNAFDKNANIRNRGVVDSLVMRGLNDVEEVQMHHKQRGHVFHFFERKEHLGRPITQLEPVVQARDKTLMEEYGIAINVGTRAIIDSVESEGAAPKQPLRQVRTAQDRRREQLKEIQQRQSITQV